jgi:hypothetical protein
VKLKNTHLPGKRFGDPRDRKHISRAGKQESARYTPGVYSHLQRREKRGRMLEFIENRPFRQIIHKSDRLHNESAAGSAAASQARERSLASKKEILPKPFASPAVFVKASLDDHSRPNT